MIEKKSVILLFLLFLRRNMLVRKGGDNNEMSMHRHDLLYLSRVAGIPQSQLRFVNNSPSETGIIKYGNVCLSFDNRMSKEENPIYALFNTSLYEKVREGAKNLLKMNMQNNRK